MGTSRKETMKTDHKLTKEQEERFDEAYNSFQLCDVICKQDSDRLKRHIAQEIYRALSEETMTTEQIKADLAYLLGYCRGIGHPVENLEAKHLSDLEERVEKLENKGQSATH